MRTQQLNPSLQLRKCLSFQRTLLSRPISSARSSDNIPRMHNYFTEEYRATTSRPQRSTFNDHRPYEQPAYQDPYVYDTSRYMKDEDKPSSPRASRRSPFRRYSPSPSPPPLPSGPSPEYLTIAAEEPSAVGDPEEQKKLLILDLNGALLWRKDKRVPYPRPYMPSFRAYLFAEETRRWLDVMVWSSAQPHNVEMMVRRCFYDRRCGYYPEEKRGVGKWEGLLVDVWARDTLGLSSHDYSRKSQTTKDLSKPWASLHELHRHSAYTTLLLDDSPAKVRLQPYNHLCVPEYNAETRNRDLQVLAEWLSRKRERGSSSPEDVDDTARNVAIPVNDALQSANSPSDSLIASDASSVASVVHETSIDGSSRDSSASTPTSPRDIKSKTRVEKRKEKKERKKQEKALKRTEEQAVKLSKTTGVSEDAGMTNSPKTTNVDGNSTPLAVGRKDCLDGEEGMGLDETLLAAIGILDEMKSQRNVAAWIKSGGLWAGNVPSVPLDIGNTDPSTIADEIIKRAPSPTDEEVGDLAPPTKEEPSAISPPYQPPSPPTSPSTTALGSSPSRPTSPEHSSQERKRFRSLTADTPSHDGESEPKKSKHGVSEDDTIVAGNDAETVGGRSSHRPHQVGAKTSYIDGGAKQGVVVNTENMVPKMWFEDEITFRAWVTRGRTALKSLGIEEQDGIEIV